MSEGALIGIFIALLIFVLFMAIIANDNDTFNLWLKNRKEKAIQKQKMQQEITMLKLKQQHELEMAAKLKDPVDLLTLDPKFGERFDQRLRVALEEKQNKTETIEEEFEEEKTSDQKKFQK